MPRQLRLCGPKRVLYVLGNSMISSCTRTQTFLFVFLQPLYKRRHTCRVRAIDAAAFPPAFIIHKTTFTGHQISNSQFCSIYTTLSRHTAILTVCIRTAFLHHSLCNSPQRIGSQPTGVIGMVSVDRSVSRTRPGLWRSLEVQHGRKDELVDHSDQAYNQI